MPINPTLIVTQSDVTAKWGYPSPITFIAVNGNPIGASTYTDFTTGWTITSALNGGDLELTVDVSSSTLNIGKPNELLDMQNIQLQFQDAIGNIHYAQVQIRVDFETVAAPATDVTIDFGELTFEGDGRVPVTGTSIVSGDPSGHWQIVGGEISPSSLGEGNISGTYTLELDNGITVTINIIPLHYSTYDQAETQLALDTAMSGETVLPRDTLTGTLSVTQNDYTGVTLNGVNSDVLEYLILDQTDGLTVQNFEIFNPNTAGITSAVTTAALQVIECENVVIEGNLVDCKTSNNEGRIPGFGTTQIEDRLYGIGVVNGDNVTIQNNEVRHTFKAITAGAGLGGGKISVLDNDLHHFLVDGIGGNWMASWEVKRNRIHYMEGWSGRRLTGAVYDPTLQVGDYVTTGSGTSLRGGFIRELGPGYVDLMYKPWEKPSVSGSTLTGPNGMVSYTGQTTAYDGPHGDGFQPLLNASTSDVELDVEENIIYMETPITYGAPVLGENTFQGILLLQNGSANRFYGRVVSNIIDSGQPIAITASRGRDLTVQKNSGFDKDVPFNIGIRWYDLVDSFVLDNTAPFIVDQGGTPGRAVNVNTVATNNLAVSGSTYSTEFPNLGSLTFDLSMYAPSATGTVESNLVGAVTPAATYRPVP